MPGAALFDARPCGTPPDTGTAKRGAFERVQHALITRACELGLLGRSGAGRIAAVDATGLESRHVSRHYARRAATKAGPGTGAHYRQRAWRKLTAVVDVASYLILGALPDEGPNQDSPDFAPALRQACAVVHVDTALADAGYDAEHNHRLCRDLGLRRSVIALNRRNTGDRPLKTLHRRALHDDFPQALYNERWQVESAFSQHKRRLGSAMTARNDQSRAREILIRVIAHDIALVASHA